MLPIFFYRIYNIHLSKIGKYYLSINVYLYVIISNGDVMTIHMNIGAISDIFDYFGDYGLGTTLLFLLGVGIGVIVFGIFYLVLILKTNDSKQIIIPERPVGQEEIVSIIKIAHSKIDSYPKDISLEFDKTKKVTTNFVNATKGLPKEIANAFYPGAKHSLMQLSVDEVLMANREIIKDAKLILDNLDGSVIEDINTIILHANNVVNKFGYNLSGKLRLSNLTIGDFLNIKSYMQQTIKFESIEGFDKNGIIKTATIAVKNRAFIKDSISEISSICLEYGIDISAEVKKIGGAFKDELNEATGGGGILKTVGGAIKTAVTTKPSATIRKVKKTVMDSTKKVVFLSADEILSSQLASLYKDLTTMIGMEVYTIYSKQLFANGKIDRSLIQQLLEDNHKSNKEVKLSLKKQLTIG